MIIVLFRSSDILRSPRPAAGRSINHLFAESNDCRGPGVYASDGTTTFRQDNGRAQRHASTYAAYY